MSSTLSPPSPPSLLSSLNKTINDHPLNPKNWSKKKLITVGIICVAVLVVIIIILSIVLSVKDSHPFMSMLRQSEHAGTPNQPVIIDSELNWNQKYNFSNNDDRTADEYYDDRIYNHAGHISAPKHKTDFKLPGTVTVYRKYTEKSAN